eukprot:scaffold66016_cov34-Prasinocladus_malaysianus.AAC.2
MLSVVATPRINLTTLEHHIPMMKRFGQGMMASSMRFLVGAGCFGFRNITIMGTRGYTNSKLVIGIASPIGKVAKMEHLYRLGRTVAEIPPP